MSLTPERISLSHVLNGDAGDFSRSILKLNRGKHFFALTYSDGIGEKKIEGAG
jgi:hypothetical protein